MEILQDSFVKTGFLRVTNYNLTLMHYKISVCWNLNFILNVYFEKKIVYLNVFVYNISGMIKQNELEFTNIDLEI